MSDRYEVVSFRKTPAGKTFAIRCGSAVKRTQGDGFQLYLDAIPAPIDGQWQLVVQPPREKQGGGNGDY